VTPGGAAAIGVDLGGSKTAVGLVDQHGTVLELQTVPTAPRRGADAVIAEVAQLVTALLVAGERSGLEVRGVGLATAGIVDGREGVLIAATDSLPGFAPLPLRADLANATGRDVVVLNDVQAMAIGELNFGAAVGAREALFVAVGTGVGGAIAHEGRLAMGAHGSAGDIGHVVVDWSSGARRCPCGRLGHLEAYVSGPALAAAYKRRVGVPLSGDDLRPVVVRAAGEDPVAKGVLREGALLLGRVVGGLANLMDIDLVVFGGGLVDVSPGLFWDSVGDAVRAEIRAPWCPRMALATLGKDAAVVGAAAVAIGGTAKAG
jgi:glucokinase